ncbi:transporter substrate-binding domain-containing protein [Marinobacter nanhaiticus D15-8W]|uniref:Amino acid ABC transporter substrate-binding protein n=1 Tax=Marinobacter nanhaiticus D15-8W TaxID=626887 RepID=N6W084_9GAMM|nr:transporter substrate-binding domain-containing protein [Marinobacter nanhaiticus]ENO15940.1 amino acid ABC transporter substrate-binding protein [Marinobacter nanhaiticus D15-8W]BES73202.1 transporter substrate-binding domain-containing protein [Marinobacter nanhaiticus D15-8W]
MKHYHTSAWRLLNVNQAKRILLAALGSLALGLSTGLQAGDLPEVKERGYMIVATEDNYAPFNFMRGSEPDGFMKDMIAELKDYSDFEVRQEILPWTGLLAAVASGQYDAAITGASVSDERLRVFNYAPPFASAQHFYIKRAGDDRIKSVADLDGMTVGVQAGSVLLSRLPELEAMLEETGGELGEVVQYEAYPEIYADLANGRLDYAINSAVPVNDLIKERGDVFEAGQAVSGPGFVGWPVPKANAELLAYLTDFLNHMRETGRLAELQEKWFGQAFDDLPKVPITSVDEFHQMAGM